MNDYVARVICNLQRQYPYEPEYLQAVQLWLELIGPAADDPLYHRTLRKAPGFAGAD